MHVLFVYSMSLTGSVVCSVLFCFFLTFCHACFLLWLLATGIQSESFNQRSLKPCKPRAIQFSSLRALRPRPRARGHTKEDCKPAQVQAVQSLHAGFGFEVSWLSRCNIPANRIISAHDVTNLFHVPGSAADHLRCPLLGGGRRAGIFAQQHLIGVMNGLLKLDGLDVAWLRKPDCESGNRPRGHIRQTR